MVRSWRLVPQVEANLQPGQIVRAGDRPSLAARSVTLGRRHMVTPGPARGSRAVRPRTTKPGRLPSVASLRYSRRSSSARSSVGAYLRTHRSARMPAVPSSARVDFPLPCAPDSIWIGRRGRNLPGKPNSAATRRVTAAFSIGVRLRPASIVAASIAASRRSSCARHAASTRGDDLKKLRIRCCNRYSASSRLSVIGGWKAGRLVSSGWRMPRSATPPGCLVS